MKETCPEHRGTEAVRCVKERGNCDPGTLIEEKVEESFLLKDYSSLHMCDK
jgi:hypothetical protein